MRAFLQFQMYDNYCALGIVKKSNDTFKGVQSVTTAIKSQSKREKII